MEPKNANPEEDARIESWKEIAAFFGRDERTVKRWEGSRNLPVHRLPGEKGGVFAYARELTIWVNSARKDLRPATEEPQATPDRSVNGVDVAARSQEEQIQAAAEPVEDKPMQASRTVRWLLPIGAVAIFALTGLIFLRFRMGQAHQPRALPAASLRTPNAQARDLYLKGRYYWNHRTDGALRQSLDAFSQAVVRDPQYAAAYAGLADSYNLMPQYSTMSKSQAFTQGLAAARKAVALDDSLAEGHRALAFGLFYWEWDVDASFREYQRAIQLDPKNVEAHSWYATSLMLSGHLPAARAEIARARELDPTSRSILANQALILSWSGDRANIANLKELENAEPDFLAPPRYLALLFLDEKNFPAYIAEIERAASISKDPDELALAAAARHGWRQGRERGMLEQMRTVYLRAFNEGRSSGYDLAHVSALLGRRQDADTYLQAAIDAHDFEAMGVLTGDFNAHMKGDPDFEKVKKQISARMQRSAAVEP